MLRRALIAICMISIALGCGSGAMLMLHHPSGPIDLTADFAGTALVLSALGFLGSVLALSVLKAFGPADRRL